MKRDMAFELLHWYRAAPIEDVAVTIETSDDKSWWLNLVNGGDKVEQFLHMEQFVVRVREMRGPGKVEA